MGDGGARSIHSRNTLTNIGGIGIVRWPAWDFGANLTPLIGALANGYFSSAKIHVKSTEAAELGRAEAGEYCCKK